MYQRHWWTEVCLKCKGFLTTVWGWKWTLLQEHSWGIFSNLCNMLISNRYRHKNKEKTALLTFKHTLSICIFPSAYLSFPELLCPCICHPDILSVSVWAYIVTVSCLTASVPLLVPTRAQNVHIHTTYEQQVIPRLSVVRSHKAHFMTNWVKLV